MILTSSITSIIADLANTRKASSSIARANNEQKLGFLKSLSLILIESISHILKQNKLDLDEMPLNDPKRDRLLLNESRIENLANSLLDIAKLPDPTNQLLIEKILPNGILLQKKTVPMGVIGVIFEARPNVVLDVTALCIRSGNAIVLKGGSDAHFSNIALVNCIEKALTANKIDTNVVLLLPSGRTYVKELLEATRYVDVIIPRGSESLIKYVRENSKVPTIETGAGVCHTYVHSEANLEKAKNIVINAKTTRVSVCNSLDTVLVDSAIAELFLPMLIEAFNVFNVEVFADETAFDIFRKANFKNLQQAKDSDFGREFLDFKCSVKVVSNIDDALNHIAEYSSKHSEAIVSENKEICQLFIDNVDAAAVYSNASTRFTDGGEFGLGAEIGISTQKLHARGPFALEKLVTEKWILTGNGQIR